MADSLPGPSPAAAVTPTDRLPSSPAALRLPPQQATVIARPPELTAAAPLTVGGVLGGARADGLLPLVTSFGTVLLRPVPGAWPPDLRPGSEISLTLGPGNRAGAVAARPDGMERAAATMATPAGNPAGARAIGAAEAGLRGLLMPARAEAAVAAQAAQAVQTAQRQAQPGATPAAQPGAPATAQAPATSAALLAAAAAGSPRAVPAAPMALPTGPGPRIAQAVQTAAAVSSPQSSVAAGAGDLMRQAALRVPGGAPAPPAGRPDAAPPPVAEGGTATVPRPDQQFLAAFAHPGMMARMAALLPRGDAAGGLALMLYLLGVRNGGARHWMGEEALARLTRREAAALDALDAEMVEGRRLTADGRSWTTILIPFLDGEELSAVLLATGGPPRPVDPDAPDGEGAGDAGPASSFILGLRLSELGEVQVTGRLSAGILHLSLTLAALPPEIIRDGFAEALAAALPAQGEARVQLRWGVPPDQPELMPGGGLPVHAASV